MANLVFDFLHHYQTGERRASDPADAYQYDEGHVMEAVVPVAVTSCEIHYWVRGQEEAEAYVPESITQNEDGSYSIIGHIPNTYFETYGELRVYIVVTDGTASITTYEGYVHICQRSMPDDYVDDDPENEATRVLTEAQEAAATATAAAETCEEVLESIPQDYSTLSDDVEDLKDGLSDLEASMTDAINSVYVTDTASGAIASFPDGADNVPVKSLTVDIEPVQSGSGDPSPDNVRPISGHTQAVVTRTGKNLVDISQFATQYPDYCSYSDGVLSVIASSVLYSTGISVFIPSGSIINWSITNGTATNAKMRFVFTDGTVVSITSPIPFQTTKDVVGLRLDWSAGGTFTVNNFQAELENTATAYESPNIQTVTIDLDGIRYGGTLNATTGVLTVDMQIVDLGTLNWSNNGADSVYATITGKASSENAISDQLVKVSSSTTVANMPDWSFKSISGGNRVAVKVSGITVQNASTMLSGVHLCYELAEPFEVTLTGHDITTVKGQNNVWSDTGDVEVEYRADTKLYIEKLTAPTEDDMIADHAISANTFFMVGNTLYRATTAIASGATITVGTNATKMSLSEALNTLS